MNSRLVRVLSVTGVLATTSAVAINAQLLDSAPASASASSTSTPGTTPSSSPGAAPVTASSEPVPGSATQVIYRAGDAATMVLDTADGTLRLVDFAPHPGWTTVRVWQPTPMDLDVRLESPSGAVHFVAGLANGAVTTDLQVDAAGATTGNSAPGNSAPSGSAPDNSAPGNSAPDNSAPSNSAPDNSGPSNSAPDNNAPGNSAPDNSAPGNTTPDDDDDSGGGSDDPPGDDHGGDD